MEHASIPPGEIHAPHNWRVTEATARLALAVLPEDIGKYCWQQDDNTEWLLVSANPAQWAPRGDMAVSAYDANADGKVNAADSADAVPWDGVTDKPATFPPSAHTHDAEQVGADPVGTAVAAAVAAVAAHTAATDPHPQYTTTVGAAAAAPVQSVAGKTGAVVLAKADVGLGNADDTSDADKPVSTAQQTALNLKAPLASPALTGVPTAPTAVAGTNTTQLATTAFVTAERSNTATLTNKTLTSPALTTESVNVVANNLPVIRPSLLLDFANSKTVDPRITFVRASTATYFDDKGVMRTAASGVPRIDHDPVTGECKGLLIEEARTNLTVNSQVATSSIGTAVTPNAALAPDGTMSMDFIYEDTTTGEHYAGDRTFTATAGTTYCFSVFIKSDGLPTNRRYYHRIAGAAVTSFVFDPNTQFISDVVNTGGYVGHGVIPCGNGVYRAWIAYTAETSTTTYNRSQLYNASSGGGSYTGGGTLGIYIWGAQIEVGAFPTSHIPTTTTGITRASDVASITGANFSSWYRQDEGTLFVNASTSPGKVSSIIFIGVDDSNRVQIGNQGNDISLYRIATAGTLFPPGFTSAPVKGARYALAYKAGAGEGIGAANGATGTAVSPTSISANTAMYIGNNSAGSLGISGHIARIAYYPKRISNAELQAITA